MGRCVKERLAWDATDPDLGAEFWAGVVEQSQGCMNLDWVDVRGIRSMGSSTETTTSCSPAEEFARLWRPGGPLPDVFEYLAARPGLTVAERLIVLQVDQAQRWRIGQPLPLRVYLATSPEIAECGEMIRVLVDGEREHRRHSAQRLNQTAPRTGTLVDPSQWPTDTIAPPVPRDLDSEGNDPAVDEELPTTAIPEPAALLILTRTPDDGPPTGPRKDLGYSLDEAHHLRAEAEALRAMLDTVRFTLVRRIGAGGMGVVYEAYDRKRGELVALKTMRRADPSTLARFKQEFRALADIAHFNLVNLYEMIAVEDRWVFTMELVEGTDFVSDTRILSLGPPTESDGSSSPPPFNEQRLRETLRQLAEGIVALHASGKLHRDIKPTNVLVTPEGRVVLLDFGLTADMESTGQFRTADRQIVGTVAHMSPEQAAGHPITTASDWYSVGVMLYEAMTGRLPFVGPPHEVILLKRTSEPLRASAIVPGLPEDLVDLCTRLLDRDPDRRPTGREVIAALTGSEPEPVDPIGPGRTLPLIGRDRHLQVLDAAFTGLVRRRTQSIFVFGRTGTGKTTLIRSFLEGLARGDDAIVLSGRCYERESVPYKALDSLIDALARYLKGLPARSLASLMPPDVAYLARLFPVLDGVPIIAAARAEALDLPDPQEARRRAIKALRVLLRRMGEKAPLVLAIDDLQWGDSESVLLLADLLGSPRAPVLLLLGCFRVEDREDGPLLVQLRQALEGRPSPPEHRELAVEALTQSEARELTLALLGRDDPVARAQAHLVARESGGNPLFVDQLVRHLRGFGPVEKWEAIGRLDLDEVLRDRIRKLPDEAQRLLETVALAGRPIDQSLAFRAAGLGAGGRAAVAALRTARLIRQAGLIPDEIEIYHDRIRVSIVEQWPPDQLRQHHHRLAEVLATSGPTDPEVLAGHFLNAGDLRRARAYYERGADQAASALAFEHAARLYRKAIELAPADSTITPSLRKRLGDALSNAGRGCEAARVYLEAASASEPAATLELKRLASAQLLISGHIDEGLALLRDLLIPMGIGMPETSRSALASLLWHRAILRARGLEFIPKPADLVPPIDLKRIDLYWSAVAGLSMVEPIRGADFQARGLLLALRVGEPFRIVRAVAMEAAHEAVAGPSAIVRVEAMLARAAALADPLDSPQAHGMVDLVRGLSSILFGRWQIGVESLARAEELFRDRCTGVAWERATGHNFALWGLYKLGEITDLRRRWISLSREARERGDLYATRYLNAFYQTILALAADDRPTNETELEAMLRETRGRTLSLQQTPAFDALMHIDLYRGDEARAWTRLRSYWPEFARSLLFRVQMIRVQMFELRARTAVALADRSSQPGRLLSQALRDARALEREGVDWARAHAHHIRAAVAACQKNAPRSIAELTLAIELYDRAEMPLLAETLRYRLAGIDPSDAAAPLREQIARRITARGIVNVDRWATMCAPGFGRVSSETSDTSG